MKMCYGRLVLGLGMVFVIHSSQSLLAPSGSESWLWDKNDLLRETYFNFFLLHHEVCDEMVMCVMTCMQIRECQSFTVANTSGGYGCTFHHRIFSVDEISYLGNPQKGLEYYMIISNCPQTDSHFLSREAHMCVSVNTNKRTKVKARQYCQSQGGDLITIDIDKKEAYIADVMEFVGGWMTQFFHVDAQAVGDVYVWDNGAPVSTRLINEPYDPSNECMGVMYAGPDDLIGQLYDCVTGKLPVICEYQI